MTAAAPLLDLPLRVPDSLLADRYELHRAVAKMMLKPGEQGRPYLWAVEPEFGGTLIIRAREFPAALSAGTTVVTIPSPGVTSPFRLTAKPERSNRGRRSSLPGNDPAARIQWLEARSAAAGFCLDGMPDVEISKLTIERKQSRFLAENALFEGRLVVTDPALFVRSLEAGIGRSRALGFGLLRIL